MFYTVGLTIRSEVSAEDMEELLDAFRPIIQMVIPSPEIHTQILDDGSDQADDKLPAFTPPQYHADPRD